MYFGQSQASCCLPWLSYSYHLLSLALNLKDWQTESHIDILIKLLARKQIILFPKMSTYSYHHELLVGCHNLQIDRVQEARLIDFPC